MAERVSARDVSLLLVLAAMWGVSFMAIKAGLDHFDPIWFAALRYDIAGLLMLAVALAVRTRGFWPANRRQWTAVVVSAALNVMGYHAFLFWGEQYTSSAVAAVVIGLNPVMATVLARAALPGERVGRGGLVGLVLGLLGLVVLVGLKPGDVFDAQGIGEIVVFGAVLSWAGGAVWVKRLHHGMPVLTFTVHQMLLGAVMLHALSLVLEGTHPKTAWNGPSVLALLYLAVLASGLGFLIYFTLLERIGPIRSSLVSYAAPVFAAAAGWLVLHEQVELRAAVALVIIALGFRLVMRPANGAPKDAAGIAPSVGGSAPETADRPR